MAGSNGVEDALATTDAEDVLSVGELNQRIATVIENAEPLQGVQVVGEVVDCNESNVAIYFTLTDGTHSVNCMLWKNRYADMDIDLEEGLEVLIGGNVDFWPEGGRLDVKPWLVQPVGEGDQRAALEKLRAELEDRGWFDDATKHPLPRYPATVGIVTSMNGDARHDVQDTIHTRYPDVNVVLEHASVQGDNAPTELAAGVACLDADPEIDVIVVGRGGGSDGDLMAFNTELVADAIFHADTPVVAAVGHRADETIADAVADYTAITPTAAGEAVVREKADALAETRDRHAALVDAYESHVDATVSTLETNLDDAYHDTTTAGVGAMRRRLDHAYESAVQTALSDLSTDLTTAYERVEHEHEKQAAIEAAREDAARVPTMYRAAIVVLLVLLGLAILALIFL